MPPYVPGAGLGIVREENSVFKGNSSLLEYTSPSPSPSLKSINISSSKDLKKKEYAFLCSSVSLPEIPTLTQGPGSQEASRSTQKSCL